MYVWLDPSWQHPCLSKWEPLPSFWLHSLLVNQELHTYRILYLKLVSDLLRSCSLGISTCFDRTPCLTQDPSVLSNEYVCLVSNWLRYSDVKTSSFWAFISPRFSSVWSSSHRTPSPFQVSIPAKFLTYMLLLTQDCPVLSKLVSVPTVLGEDWTVLRRSISHTHDLYSRSECIGPYSDLWPPLHSTSFFSQEVSLPHSHLCVLLPQDFVSRWVSLPSVLPMCSTVLKTLHPLHVTMSSKL